MQETNRSMLSTKKTSIRMLKSLVLGIERIEERVESLSLDIKRIKERIKYIGEFIFKKEINLEINGVKIIVTEKGDIKLYAEENYIDIKSGLLLLDCDDDNKVGQSIYELKRKRDVQTIENRGLSNMLLRMPGEKQSLREWSNTNEKRRDGERADRESTSSSGK